MKSWEPVKSCSTASTGTAPDSGFDIELIDAVKEAVSIPVIASSGAGSPDHFLEVFTRTAAESALAAGIFHRREVPIAAVKNFLRDAVEIRP